MKSITGSVQANVRRDGELGGEGLVVRELPGCTPFSAGNLIARIRGSYRISTWAGRSTPLAAIICRAFSFALDCSRLRLSGIAGLITHLGQESDSHPSYGRLRSKGYVGDPRSDPEVVGSGCTGHRLRSSRCSTRCESPNDTDAIRNAGRACLPTRA
jgi:hypothetical protein